MRLKITHLDTPTALAQLLQNETANAAFYHFTADHHLALIKLPENMVHPHPGGGNRPAESCECPKNYRLLKQIYIKDPALHLRKN